MTSFSLKASSAAIAVALSIAATSAAASTTTTNSSAAVTIVDVSNQAPITAAEVQEAQRAWGDALVAISTEYERNGRAAAARLAGQVLDSAYGYNLGNVLFKPTLTTNPQTFRPTREGALSYFVGGDRNFASDSGFALKGWRSVNVDTRKIFLSGATAMSMGKVSMTDAKGKVTTVDKTWGYVRGPDGKLRIVLHHSSLPYSG